MKSLLLFIIRMYQKLPLKSHRMCRFYPTCSEYAIKSIEIYGAFKGSYLAFLRILRCRPGGGSGYDPVLEKEN